MAPISIRRKRLLILTLLLFVYRSRLRHRTYLRVSSLYRSRLFQSQWTKQRIVQDDRAYRITTGISIIAFNYLYNQFKSLPYWSNNNHCNSIGPYNMLGLVLQYMRTQGTQYQLQQVFGYGACCVSTNINIGIKLLSQMLFLDSYSKIVWPTEEEMELYSILLNNRYPALNDKVFGFVDGFRLRIINFNNELQQNAYYNRKYLSNVANVIVVVPTGVVVYATINYPGSWHDSRIAKKLYNQLNQHHNGYKLITDQGFYESNSNKILSSKSGIEAVTSIRQSVEWGIHAIKASWRRLHHELTTDTNRNKNLILLAILLNNFKSRFDRINQINTVFNSN